MTALIEEAMEAGAAGFATSMALTHVGADGRPIPSRVAQPEETQALCRAVGRSGRGVIGVNGGEGLSFTECYDLQPSFGAPITYTAVLTVPSGAHLKAAEIHRERRARGADVWPQVSCRPLAFSVNLVEPFNLNTNPVFAELMPRSIDERRAAYADPGWRQKVRDAWADAQGHPAAVGHLRDHGVDRASRARRQEARDRRTSERGTDPFDTLLDLSADERDIKALRVKTILANDDADGIAMLLNEPGCTLGLSDAGAHVGQLCDAPLPTDLLGNWVREREVLSLEGAVHKLTQEPADLFGFADRGVLRPGAFADVTVFDPTAVGPGPVRRVRDFPADTERLTADQPTGVRHVLVNGVAHPCRRRAAGRRDPSGPCRQSSRSQREGGRDEVPQARNDRHGREPDLPRMHELRRPRSWWPSRGRSTRTMHVRSSSGRSRRASTSSTPRTSTPTAPAKRSSAICSPSARVATRSCSRPSSAA